MRDQGQDSADELKSGADLEKQRGVWSVLNVERDHLLNSEEIEPELAPVLSREWPNGRFHRGTRGPQRHRRMDLGATYRNFSLSLYSGSCASQFRPP